MKYLLQALVSLRFHHSFSVFSVGLEMNTFILRFWNLLRIFKVLLSPEKMLKNRIQALFLSFSCERIIQVNLKHFKKFIGGQFKSHLWLDGTFRSERFQLKQFLSISSHKLRFVE